MATTIREARTEGILTADQAATLQGRKRAARQYAKRQGMSAADADYAAAAYEADLARRGFPMAARRNVWLQTVLADFYAAAHAWDLECEAVAIGYDTEIAEYAEAHPRPTFRDFLLDWSDQRLQHRSDWAA